MIEFRLQLRHPLSLRRPIWAQLWPYGTAHRRGGHGSGKSANEIQKHFEKSFDFHRDSSLRLKLFSPYGTAQRRGGLGSGISAKKIQKCCENCALIRSLKLKIQVFDHNFTRSARIELRFWEVANLEKLNNFYRGHF